MSSHKICFCVEVRKYFLELWKRLNENQIWGLTRNKLLVSKCIKYSKDPQEPKHVRTLSVILLFPCIIETKFSAIYAVHVCNIYPSAIVCNIYVPKVFTQVFR